jgi:hypothetical protein
VLGEGALENRAVSRPDGCPHAIGDLAIGQASERLELSRHETHRHLAGDLAGRVTAHAIGNDKDPAIGNENETILIPRPDDADIGATSRCDVHVTPR